MAEYASNAKGNAALTTGIIGTSLGAIAAAGGLTGLLGGRPPMGGGDLELIRENAQLKAERYADAKFEKMQEEIYAQKVESARQEEQIKCLSGRVASLEGMTRRVIPNDNLNPGYGNAQVWAAPPLPPYPYPFPFPPVTPPTVQQSTTGGSTAGTTGT